MSLCRDVYPVPASEKFPGGKAAASLSHHVNIRFDSFGDDLFTHRWWGDCGSDGNFHAEDLD